MRTARLPTVLASVVTRCQTHGGRGGGPQVNKFDQVSSGGHQMSLAGGGRARVGSLMSDLMRGRGSCEVQCVMDNGHMGTSP